MLTFSKKFCLILKKLAGRYLFPVVLNFCLGWENPCVPVFCCRLAKLIYCFLNFFRKSTYCLLCVCDMIVLETKLLYVKPRKMRNNVNCHIVHLHKSCLVLSNYSRKLKSYVLLNENKEGGSLAEPLKHKESLKLFWETLGFLIAAVKEHFFKCITLWNKITFFSVF